MMKIYNDERWDEDDTCIECGDDLARVESRVPGVCTTCFCLFYAHSGQVDDLSLNFVDQN